jgi:hypothetical protein
LLNTLSVLGRILEAGAFPKTPALPENMKRQKTVLVYFDFAAHGVPLFA